MELNFAKALQVINCLRCDNSFVVMKENVLILRDVSWSVSQQSWDA